MPAFTPVGVEAQVKGLGSFLRDMGKMDSSIQGTADRTEKSGARIGRLGSKFASLGKMAATAAVTGIAALGAAAVAVGVGSLKAAIDFESAFAGVVKTTDGLVDEFGDLTEAGEEIQQGFRDMSKEVPLAVEELLAIGEVGGQLGVARDDLLAFTETIAAMGVSTNLTTDAAATGFAQLANVMGTTERLGGEAFARLGSSIVALGNTSATTEADILNFAQRIAGAAAVAGVSEADVLGIGAAFSSVGVQAEAGGTAVQKVLLGMNTAIIEGGDQLEVFAATAGMHAQDFANLWEEDAGDAFLTFVEGLGAAGDDAIFILEELGLQDQRLIKAFLSLAGAGDTLNDSLLTSRIAWNENIALTEEAEKRYETTAAQFTLVKNSVKDMAITIGQVLLPFLKRGIDAAKPFIDDFGRKLPGLLENTLIPALKELSDFLGQVLPVAIGLTRDIIMNVWIPALQAAWSFIQDSVLPVLQQLWAWLSENIPVALQFLSDLWTNTLLPAIQAIGEFIETTLIPAFQQFVDFLVATLVPIIEEVVAFAIEIFQSWVDWVEENWPLIQETIQTVMTFISNVIQTALAAISAFWQEHGATIMAAVSAAWEAIKAIIQGAMTIAQGVIETIMQVINGDWDAAWETIKTTLETAWEFLKEAILQGATFISNLFAVIKETWPTIWATIWNAIQTAVQTVIDALPGIVRLGLILVKSAFRVILDGIKALVSAAWDKITELFDKGVEKAKGFITNATDAFKSAGAAIVDAIKDGIAGAWDDLTSWLNDKLGSLTDLLPFSEPKSPRSNLRGLGEAGKAIVKNIQAGMADAMPAIQATLNAAVDPLQAAPAVTMGGNITNMTNINQIDVTSMPASQPSEQAIFFDVSAALAAARAG